MIPCAELARGQVKTGDEEPPQVLRVEGRRPNQVYSVEGADALI